MRSTLNFLFKCKGRRDEGDEQRKDNLFSEVARRSTERGTWFYTALSSTSYEARGSVIGSAALDQDQKFVTDVVALKERASITPKGVYPRTFTIKACTDESKHSFANMFVILESIPTCKLCKGSLSDINEILLSLDNDKVSKVLMVSMEGQQELFGCRLCKKTTTDDEHMRIHLLEHIEAKEVICDNCEIAIQENLPKTVNSLTLYDKSLERVSLSQVIVSCKLCNTIVQSSPVMFPEAFTIKLSMNVTEPHCCSECGSQLHPTDRTMEYYTFEEELCKDCVERIENKFKEMEGELWSSTESFASSGMDEEGCQLPFIPRNIHITSRNIPLRVESSDFIIEDEVKGMKKVWYTCRFCGDSLNDYENMLYHINDHLAINKVVCDDCCTSICWY